MSLIIVLLVVAAVIIIAFEWAWIVHRRHKDARERAHSARAEKVYARLRFLNERDRERRHG